MLSPSSFPKVEFVEQTFKDLIDVSKNKSVMPKTVNLGNGLCKFKPHFLLKVSTFFAGVHLHACAHASVYVCILWCTHLQSPEEGYYPLPYFIEIKSLTEPGPRLLADKTQQSSFVGAGVTGVPMTFYMASGIQN